MYVVKGEMDIVKIMGMKQMILFALIICKDKTEYSIDCNGECTVELCCDPIIDKCINNTSDSENARCETLGENYRLREGVCINSDQIIIDNIYRQSECNETWIDIGDINSTNVPNGTKEEKCCRLTTRRHMW